MKEKVCENCKFALGTENNSFICKRFPPTLPIKKNKKEIGAHLYVNPKQVCFEFKPARFYHKDLRREFKK